MHVPSLFPRRVLDVFLVVVLGGCNVDDGAPPRHDDDSTSGEPGPGRASTTVAASTTGFMPICTPDERRCMDDTAMEICAPTGLTWERVSCGDHARCCSTPECLEVQCLGPCDALKDQPSSAGCAFVANRNLHNLPDYPDGIVLGNPNPEGTAHVEIFYVPEGTRDPIPYEELPELWLGPGEITEDGVPLRTAFLPGYDSILRTGGIFRIVSDLPIIASQHAPLQANTGNDSSLLLPDTSLGMTYVVASYPAVSGPSYVTIVALEDETEVEWTPKLWPTGGNGLPVPPVAVAETKRLRLSRYETLQLVPSDNDLPDDRLMALRVRDVSGTVIRATRPIWVLGGTQLSRVPLTATAGTADPLQEVLFPVEQWGTRYVAAAPPSRDDTEPVEGEDPPPEQESWYLRLFAGQDDVTITASPEHPGFPVVLETIGDFVELEVPIEQNLVLSANRKFLPVQYQRSRILTFDLPDEDVDLRSVLTRGDPAMVQLVPVDQFLDRYTFATGVGFAFNDVQVTREAGNAPVYLRATARSGLDIEVEGYVRVGDFEVATVAIDQGGYEIWSADPFGILQSGSTRSLSGQDPGCAQNDGGNDPERPVESCNATYAYPGGLRAVTIVVP